MPAKLNVKTFTVYRSFSHIVILTLFLSLCVSFTSCQPRLRVVSHQNNEVTVTCDSALMAPVTYRMVFFSDGSVENETSGLGSFAFSIKQDTERNISCRGGNNAEFSSPVIITGRSMRLSDIITVYRLLDGYNLTIARYAI